MPAQVEFKEHEKLLRKFAFRVSMRAKGAGSHVVQMEDIFQELCVAWCIARENWDESHGIPFVPYLRRGMMNHINRWIGREILTYNATTLDLDAPSEDDSGDLHEVIADDRIESADDALARKQITADSMDFLSERARIFIQLLHNPPPYLFKVINALGDQRQFAIARGVEPGFRVKSICASMVFDLMGADRRERSKIYKELKTLCKLEEAIDG